MKRSVFPLLLPALALVLCVRPPAPVRAGDDATQKPETAVVRRVSFGDRVETKGRFVPADAQGVEIEVEAYSGPFEIEELAPFGPVEEGQPLIRFKKKWYERQVQRLGLDIQLARVKLELQEKGFERKQVSIRLSKLAAERSYERAKDDFAFFDEADEKMRFEEREQAMQSRRDRLENQKEDLAQLEKMYEADDLTEETEDIVLKRARRSLKRAVKSMAFGERRYERWLKRTRGRDREDRALKLEKTKLEYERVLQSADAELEQTYLQLKKARLGLRDLEEKMDKLKADEAQLELRAPVQGVLHPGGWSRGWKGYTAMKRALEVGERVKAGSPLMTVLPKGPLAVETSVEEKDLLHVAPGLGVGVSPIADASTTLRGHVTEVSPVGEKGRFAVRAALDETDARMFPGMACKVSILTSTGSRALVVPARAVVQDGDRTLVYVVDESGTHPVAIVPGAAHAGLVSVAKGLAEGDVVRLDPPQPKDADGGDAKPGKDEPGKGDSESSGGEGGR